jgi:hypothetical protein
MGGKPIQTFLGLNLKRSFLPRLKVCINLLKKVSQKHFWFFKGPAVNI